MESGDYNSVFTQGDRQKGILSVNGACPLVICAVPTPVKTTPELSGPVFGVLPKTGDENWKTETNLAENG